MRYNGQTCMNMSFKILRVVAVSENRSISAIGPTMPMLRKNQYVKLELVKPFWVLHSTLFYMLFAVHLQFIRKRALVGGVFNPKCQSLNNIRSAHLIKGIPFLIINFPLNVA